MQFEGAFPDKAGALCVACQAGKRSEMAAHMLSQAGYTNLKNVEGGFAGKSGSWGGGWGVAHATALVPQHRLARADRVCHWCLNFCCLQPGLEPTCRWRSEPVLMAF